MRVATKIWLLIIAILVTARLQAQFTLDCNKLTVEFTSQAIPDSSVWEWGDGQQVKNQPKAVHTYSIPGKYKVVGKAWRNKILWTDTGTVTIVFPENKLFVDGDFIITCNKQTTLKLIPLPEGTIVTWQDDQSHVTSREVTQSKVYKIDLVSKEGCHITDSIYIEFKAPITFSLGPDTTLCEGASYQIQVPSVGGSYLWSDGTTNTSIVVKKPGIYWLKIINTFCKAIDSVNITYINIPSVNIGYDTVLCAGNKLILKNSSKNSAYLWSDLSTADSIVVEATGNYHVTAVNQCGTVTDSINVTFEECACDVYIPNAFTPNNNLLNDIFKPYYNCPTATSRFEIFDRWGALIFATENPNEGWDGKINGKLAPSGVYAYKLWYAAITGGGFFARKTITGVVNLER